MLKVLMAALIITIAPLHAEFKEKAYMGIVLNEVAGNVEVTSILPGGSGEKAGIQKGDIILEITDIKISSISQAIGLIRTHFAGETISFKLKRDNKFIISNVFLLTPPRERHPKLDIEYASFKNNGVEFRAVFTAPRNSKGKILPALFMVSALNSPLLVQHEGYDMHREVAYQISLRGFRVVRFELRSNYKETDFNTETEDNLAAFEYLKSRSDVDVNKIFIWGHSTGGTIAALVAAQTKNAGLIASSSIGRTFFERMLDTIRLQGILSGKTPSEIDTNLKKHLLFSSLIQAGNRKDGIQKDHPELIDLINKNGRIYDDRSFEYFKQWIDINIAEVYGNIKSPILLVWGDTDYLISLACQKAIMSYNRGVTLKIIHNMNHWYVSSSSFKESYQMVNKLGSKKINRQAINEIAQWLKNKSRLKI